MDEAKARIRLENEIEIGLEFNQSEGRKPISSLVNFALIGQDPIKANWYKVIGLSFSVLRFLHCVSQVRN